MSPDMRSESVRKAWKSKRISYGCTRSDWLFHCFSSLPIRCKLSQKQQAKSREIVLFPEAHQNGFRNCAQNHSDTRVNEIWSKRLTYKSFFLPDAHRNIYKSSIWIEQKPPFANISPSDKWTIRIYEYLIKQENVHHKNVSLKTRSKSACEAWNIKEMPMVIHVVIWLFHLFHLLPNLSQKITKNTTSELDWSHTVPGIQPKRSLKLCVLPINYSDTCVNEIWFERFQTDKKCVHKKYIQKLKPKWPNKNRT